MIRVVCGRPDVTITVEVAEGVVAGLCAQDASWAPMLLKPEVLDALKDVGEPTTE